MALYIRTGLKPSQFNTLGAHALLLKLAMRNGCLPSIIMCLGLTLSLVGHAIELEYIGPDKKQDLEVQFAQADFSSKDAAKLKQKKWTCDMYGVRSGLQVKRGIKLYHWNNEWHNDGAQVVREYQSKDGKLTGQNDRFEDQVRLNSQGQLISRLTLIKPDRQVVAYSVCDAL